MKTIAYAYRSGEIGFGERIPTGALYIASGDESTVSAVRGLARRAYDNETYLVPGVPEAPDDQVALQALCTFMEHVKTALKRQKSA